MWHGSMLAAQDSAGVDFTFNLTSKFASVFRLAWNLASLEYASVSSHKIQNLQLLINLS